MLRSLRCSTSVRLKDDAYAQLTVCQRFLLRSRLATVYRILLWSAWFHLFVTSSSSSLCLFAFTPVSVTCALLVLVQHFLFIFPSVCSPVTVVPAWKVDHAFLFFQTCPTSDHTKYKCDCQLDFPKAFNREVRNYWKLMKSVSVSLFVLPTRQQPHVNFACRFNNVCYQWNEPLPLLFLHSAAHNGQTDDCIVLLKNCISYLLLWWGGWAKLGQAAGRFNFFYVLKGGLK